MTNDTETLRAQFEKLLSDSGRACLYEGDGQYAYPHDFAWLCYQAGHAAAKAETVDVGEPVAWRVHPFDYGVGYEGAYALTSRPDQVVAWERKGWEVQPLFTAPQPAEPVKGPSDDLAHEIWAAAQTAPGEGIEDAVERIAALLARRIEEERE